MGGRTTRGSGDQDLGRLGWTLHPVPSTLDNRVLRRRDPYVRTKDSSLPCRHVGTLHYHSTSQDPPSPGTWDGRSVQGNWTATWVGVDDPHNHRLLSIGGEETSERKVLYVSNDAGSVTDSLCPNVFRIETEVRLG